MTAGKDNAIQLKHYNLWIRKGHRETQILKDLCLTIRKGERWGIVGESGAGKSMTMYSLTALLPEKSTRTEGSILFRTAEGTWEDLFSVPYKDRQKYCAEKTALILQDSIHALNPYEKIGTQWKETMRFHHPELPREQESDQLLERLDRFGIQGGQEIFYKYPHQLSGGMKQRIAIGMALESKARILIADEPTTSLDAINQRKVVDYIRLLCEERGLTLLYISHNLGIIQKLCTHAVVMKDGEMIETGTVWEIFDQPKMPYTKKLLEETRRLYRREEDCYELSE